MKRQRSGNNGGEEKKGPDTKKMKLRDSEKTNPTTRRSKAATSTFFQPKDPTVQEGIALDLTELKKLARKLSEVFASKIRALKNEQKTPEKHMWICLAEECAFNATPSQLQTQSEFREHFQKNHIGKILEETNQCRLVLAHFQPATTGPDPGMSQLKRLVQRLTVQGVPQVGLRKNHYVCLLQGCGDSEPVQRFENSKKMNEHIRNVHMELKKAGFYGLSLVIVHEGTQTLFKPGQVSKKSKSDKSNSTKRVPESPKIQGEEEAFHQEEVKIDMAALRKLTQRIMQVMEPKFARMQVRKLTAANKPHEMSWFLCLINNCAFEKFLNRIYTRTEMDDHLNKAHKMRDRERIARDTKRFYTCIVHGDTSEYEPDADLSPLRKLVQLWDGTSSSTDTQHLCLLGDCGVNKPVRIDTTGNIREHLKSHREDQKIVQCRSLCYLNLVILHKGLDQDLQRKITTPRIPERKTLQKKTQQKRSSTEGQQLAGETSNLQRVAGAKTLGPQFTSPDENFPGTGTQKHSLRICYDGVCQYSTIPKMFKTEREYRQHLHNFHGWVQPRLSLANQISEGPTSPEEPASLSSAGAQHTSSCGTGGSRESLLLICRKDDCQYLSIPRAFETASDYGDHLLNFHGYVQSQTEATILENFFSKRPTTQEEQTPHGSKGNPPGPKPARKVQATIKSPKTPKNVRVAFEFKQVEPLRLRQNWTGRPPVRRPPKQTCNFKCICCDLKFSTKNRLYRHFRTGDGKIDRTCLWCKCRFPTAKALRSHTEEMHPQGRHKCSDCGDIFKAWPFVKQHFDKHHFDKVVCLICYQIFPDYAAAKEHLWDFHHGGRKDKDK